ncbi:MAG TPA: lasso peptide biosynthesis B2 protein [Stellaceae bacterium]|nr:lasso peptide biosynthesis B2 protein [Stellaceae bacterium]
MGKVAKFFRIAPADRRLLVEASLLLLLARAALKLLPFRTLVRILFRPVDHGPGEAEASTIVGRVRWAVLSGARNGPVSMVCFPQAIAAHLMLRRRRVPSTLYYGVAKTADGGIEAHVWVRAGALPVVGCETAARFTVMTTFPLRSDPLARSAGSPS